jgi:anti-anti-sigma regulatory factor
MGTPTFVLDCSALDGSDAGQVEALCFLQLRLRRRGGRLRLVNASEELLGLLELCGVAGELGVEPRRQSPEREEPGGVEEEGDLGDPAP